MCSSRLLCRHADRHHPRRARLCLARRRASASVLEAAAATGRHVGLKDLVTPEITIAFAALTGWSGWLRRWSRSRWRRNVRMAPALIMSRPIAMVEALDPDICVIGGAGQEPVGGGHSRRVRRLRRAGRARGHGRRLDTGCIPSKALLAAARHAQALREARHFGVLAPEPAMDFAAVQRHVHGVIAEIAPSDSAERFAALGVTVIKAEARFVDARTVLAGDTPVQARRSSSPPALRHASRPSPAWIGSPT